MTQLKTQKKYLDTKKSFIWLGGLEVRLLRVTGKPTGFTGMDGVETSAGFRLVLGFSAEEASLGGGNSWHWLVRGEWRSERSIWHTERQRVATRTY